MCWRWCGGSWLGRCPHRWSGCWRRRDCGRIWGWIEGGLTVARIESCGGSPGRISGSRLMRNSIIVTNWNSHDWSVLLHILYVVFFALCYVCAIVWIFSPRERSRIAAAVVFVAMLCALAVLLCAHAMRWFPGPDPRVSSAFGLGAFVAACAVVAAVEMTLFSLRRRL